MRYYFVTAIVAALFGVIIWRLLDLSYFNRGEYFSSLERTRRSVIIEPARRGTIYDRNFEVLAFDEKKIILGADPYACDTENDFKKICILSDLLGIDTKTILKKLEKKREIRSFGAKKIRWVPICEINSESLYSAVKFLGIKGIYGMENRRRSYAFGREMSHVTGAINKESIPISGVERYMDFYLRGQDGYIESEKDGGAHELAQYRKKEIFCRNGYDVILSIDENIQKIVYQEAQKIVETFDPHSISIIVSDVATGEILALVNYPDYDPNNYGKFPLENMKNLAVCSIYEPGSVFKIIAMSFGLEYCLVDEESIFDCTKVSVISRGKKVTLPKDHTPFDKLTFVDAVRKSSNRAAAQTAMLIGEKSFYDCVCAYGFGERAGYGFDSESAGILLPVSKWDPWTITRLPMGHAVGVVPLQTHCAMSVIANNGVLMKPNLFKSVLDGDKEVMSVNPVTKRRVISQQTAIRMRKVMHNPQNGTLKTGIEFGGKSGTGQKIIDGKYSHERHTSSYSGFFPVAVPRIVVTVIVDDAKAEHGIAWGSTVSLPAFKNISGKISQYLDL